MPILIIEKSERENLVGHEFEVYEDTVPTLIGRQPSSGIAIKDQRASRNHARIFQHHGSWFLEDLDSRNGVYVIDRSSSRWKRVSRKQLSDSELFRIGSTIIRFRRSREHPSGKTPRKKRRKTSLGLHLIIWTILWAGLFVATRTLTELVMEKLNGKF